MPKCDGYEATKQIRQLDDPNKRKIRIVALTASAIVGDRQRCIASGMDSYLSSTLASVTVSWPVRSSLSPYRTCSSTRPRPQDLGAASHRRADQRLMQLKLERTRREVRIA